jgi:HrpA-like RNA helicase
LQFCGGL